MKGWRGCVAGMKFDLGVPKRSKCKTARFSRVSRPHGLHVQTKWGRGVLSVL